MSFRHKIIVGFLLYLSLTGTESRQKRQTNNPCDSNPCKNGGSCTSNGNNYTCTCTNQFRGRDCESTGKCSAGWEIYGDKCFKFSTSTSGWDASQNSCENDENGYLAEIYSEGENRFLEYIGQQISSLTSGVWIGLRWHNSWDDFYWVNSSVVYTYDNKLASCNSGYSYKYCIIFDQSNGKWCQQNCTTYSNYICEKAAEDDPCFPNPCQNGGTCSVNGNDYTCNCQAGFTGKSCETSGYCQPGWAHYGRNCFKFSGSVKSWEAAKSACETEANGYLAEIYNAEENNLLETTGKENSTLSSGVWIGLRWHSGWDDFYWMNSSVVYTYDGMLASCNTGYAYKYCIIFNQSNGNWCQQNCTTNSNYICEKQVSDNPCTQMPCKNGGTCTQQSNGYTCTCTSQYIGTNCEKTFCPMAWSYLDGKCYLYTDDTVSWSSARNVCLSSGGDLARIDNAVQNKFLYNLRSNAHNPAWIGLNDIETENVFKWAGTQRTASYTNWSPHEPNNGLWYGEEDCIEMTNTEKWNDNFCHLYRGFFCERSNLIA